LSRRAKLAEDEARADAKLAKVAQMRAAAFHAAAGSTSQGAAS
jgi:hypothetical protein